MWLSRSHIRGLYHLANFLTRDLFPLKEYSYVAFLVKHLIRLKRLIIILLNKCINVALVPSLCMDQIMPFILVAYLTRDDPNDPSLLHSLLSPLK